MGDLNETELALAIAARGGVDAGQLLHAAKAAAGTDDAWSWIDKLDELTEDRAHVALACLVITVVNTPQALEQFHHPSGTPGEWVHAKWLDDDRLCGSDGFATLFYSIVTCPECKAKLDAEAGEPA